MGECVYSMIAVFPKRVSRDRARSIVRFFIQGSHAYDYWQENRGKSRRKFWPEFKRRFPVVSEYLASAKYLGANQNNELAGMLDFGSGQDIQENMEFFGKEMRYWAEIWHMANWGPLTSFLKSKFGAEEVWSGNEEDGVSLDSLLAERKIKRYEEIIVALLKGTVFGVENTPKYTEIQKICKAYPELEAIVNTVS